ncbi:MAG: 2-isopropylmalate synthase [Candidatus Omnitrophota bacterium]
MEKIIIFDTTLRDGEQSPGASLGVKEKVEIALQLEKLGVNVIEAGFPISSPGDFEAVQAVSKAVKKPIVCALARAREEDIQAAAEAVKKAVKKRIHVFLATSKIHMKYKLKKPEGEILKLAEKAVRFAKKYCDDIEFSPEDAARTQEDFLFEVLEAVINAGATTLNIPDTVGYSTPDEFGSLIAKIKKNVPNIEKAVISVHCHNDLGLGVANSLAAVKNGAKQVECTINGLGERAGNASLEEIVMALKTRNDFYHKTTSINTPLLYKTSRLVSNLTGIIVQPNKAIVGQNAFSHEAGIHQDGVLKKRITYEIMAPADVGFLESNIVLGKHSGRHAFYERLKELGYKLGKKEIDDTFKRFKELTDKKKEIFDEDLEALIEERLTETPQVWSLAHLETKSTTASQPQAIVALKGPGGKIEKAVSTGDGQVDACYKAIEKITKQKGKLEDYSIKSVSKGKDALGEVRVRVKFKNNIISGHAASTDIIEASIKAYLNAINKFIAKSQMKSANAKKGNL